MQINVVLSGITLINDKLNSSLTQNSKQLEENYQLFHCATRHTLLVNREKFVKKG